MQESTSGFNTTDSRKGYTYPLEKRSYFAMILSAVLPGLGQIYLNNTIKGFILIIVYISSIGIFYINSYPVRDWDDLMRFKSLSDSQTVDEDTDRSIHLWTLDNGDALMFRPTWILKITALIQGLACWFYAVYDGWRGRLIYSLNELQSE